MAKLCQNLNIVLSTYLAHIFLIKKSKKNNKIKKSPAYWSLPKTLTPKYLIPK